MSDRYQGFVQTPIGKLLVKNLGLPNPVPLERYVDGEPLVDGTVAVGGTGRLAESLPGILDLLGIASTAVHRRGREVQGPGLRRHRADQHLRALRAARLLHPAAPQPRDLPPRGRARHPAGVRRGERARGPACAGGLHPQPRQGARPRRHRPAGLRRRGGRGRHRLHPGLPALPQVRLRVRPGDPDRRHRRDEAPPRSTTCSGRWPARSPSSPAPAAASASRSPGSSTATAPPSSVWTCPRPPASCRR